MIEDHQVDKKPWSPQYDYEYDVVVIGSSCSGLTTAIVAAKRGLRVLVIENTGYYGETTGCYLGGGSSIGPGMTFGFRAGEHLVGLRMLSTIGNWYPERVVNSYKAIKLKRK